MREHSAAWRNALAQWQQLVAEETARSEKAARRSAPAGWWIEAFADPRNASEIKGHPCGAKEMLVIVAYDIADPRRLSRVAKFCLDFGLRIQYSMFECQLPAAEFDRLWDGLKELIDPENDRIVAYKICAGCAREVLEAGTMARIDGEVLAYVF